MYQIWSQGVWGASFTAEEWSSQASRTSQISSLEEHYYLSVMIVLNSIALYVLRLQSSDHKAQDISLNI